MDRVGPKETELIAYSSWETLSRVFSWPDNLLLLTYFYIDAHFRVKKDILDEGC